MSDKKINVEICISDLTKEELVTKVADQDDKIKSLRRIIENKDRAISEINQMIDMVISIFENR